MKKHIVFVGHDASRTGAPIVLLHFLRWLKKEGVYTFSIMLLKGGDLESAFMELAPTYIWQYKGIVKHSRWQSLLRRVNNRIHPNYQEKQNQHEQRIITALRMQQPSVVYGNTVVSAELTTRLKREFDCHAVCHVHELRIAIERYFGTTRFGKQLPYLDLLIVASEAVRNNLLETYGLVVRRMVKVYEFVPAAEEVSQESSISSIRQTLGIPAKSMVVAASGTLDWRKSPDLFIQMAGFMSRSMVNMPYFVWVGGEVPSLAYEELMNDANKIGISNYIRIIGSQSNPLDYLRLADVFVLTSREDPYPLVCLEAATLGKPIVCFEQAGGIPEFVENDCGIIVPYLRPDLLAAAVQELLINPERRQLLGQNALRKVHKLHRVEIAGRQIVEQLSLLCSEEAKQ